MKDLIRRFSILVIYIILVGVIYRLPDSDIDIFKTTLELLYCINKTNKTCFILGDFNIDLAKDDTMTNYFINILHSSSLLPTINTFTSISESSRKIVNDILTNSLKVCIDSGIISSHEVLNEKSLQKLGVYN